MAHGDSIRSLYAWGLGAAAGLVGLVWWFTPSQPQLAQATSTPAPARHKVRISALAPPLPSGTTVMASFPDLQLTLPGQLLPNSPPGTVEAEFDVPGPLPPAQVELWTQAPDGHQVRWNTTPLEGAGARLGPPQPPPLAGTARDMETYRYPSPAAKPPGKADTSLRLPPGTTLPAGIHPMTAEQLKAMGERYHAHP